MSVSAPVFSFHFSIPSMYLCTDSTPFPQGFLVSQLLRTVQLAR